ncbi:helix-turn-helix domain-containing protein [Ruminiclostridium cellobioparum]|uniref:AraC family transcriptional regulator n=1 Tax=Ruminiclostridium cellobioparum subsp. termitidis CT1112 TaxID=1195236 RepID=S0FNX2_RUMCE|nr:AraC family transcriptional regulator [Ruminiclostridium cellobioparum]EMS70819.1 AraC family transcriptional regulator [Ruminiclostridium cellobioparum subsp. termitidis CT1112]
MEARHQTTINKYTGHLPVNVFNTDVQVFPPHWHERVEIVYVLGEELNIGLNNSVYTLHNRDILIINMGEIHYFLKQPQKCDRIIIHFDLSLFEEIAHSISGRRLTEPLITCDTSGGSTGSPVHEYFERNILDINNEIKNKEPGFEFFVAARLCELAAGMIRYIPNEKLCPADKNKQIKKLELLEEVTKYIDKNLHREISLSEAAKYVNFSKYHFTRFFKDTTGMTFWKYLNNYKVSKAANRLINSSDSILEIAFDSGFNSIKTFNRVFKQVRGCSPSDFKKAIIE